MATDSSEFSDRVAARFFDLGKTLVLCKRFGEAVLLRRRVIAAAGRSRHPLLQDVRPSLPPNLIDLGILDIADIAGTAATMRCMDLVIAPCSGMAHLAAGEDSEWSPNVRIFRQRQEGNWSAAVEAVAERLSGFGNSRLPLERGTPPSFP